MGLISAADQEHLREEFAKLTRPVRLLFFTQAVGCESCHLTGQVLHELPPLSDKITVEEVNFVLEGERAAQYGIDRVPAIAVTYVDDEAQKDSRIRFLGTPAGYEFISLIRAVLLAGGGRPSDLSEAGRGRLALVDRPTTMQVFTTPTCPHCPRAVMLAHEMAFVSPHITAFAVEATEFPDLARRFRVSGVPKTIVNGDVEVLGALPEPAFIEQALGEAPDPSNLEP